MRQMLELQSTGTITAELMRNEVETYTGYLADASSAETALPVPSLTVDLLWHSHMLFPSRYANECLHVAGVLIDHDDDA